MGLHLKRKLQLSTSLTGLTSINEVRASDYWVSAANRSSFPDNVYTAGATQVFQVSDVAFWTGERGFNRIEAGFYNGYLDATGDETASGASVTYKAKIVIDGVATDMLTAGGDASVTLASGETAQFFADVLLPANTKYFVRTYAACAEGPQVRSYRVSNTNWGEGCRYTSSSSTADTDFAAGSPASNTLVAIGPSWIAGRVVGGAARCVAILGDSIADGTAEDARVNESRGNRGMIRRGLDAAAIPILVLTRAGSTLASLQGGNCTIRKGLVQRFATHALVEMMENNIGNGFATMSSTYEGIVDDWQTLNDSLRMVGWHILPKSTGAWTLADESDQTAANAATRTQMRDFVDGLVTSGKLTGRVSCWPYVHGTDSSKWIANGTVQYATTDGLHPSTAGHILGVQGISDAVTDGLFDM